MRGRNICDPDDCIQEIRFEMYSEVSRLLDQMIEKETNLEKIETLKVAQAKLEDL